MLAQNFKTPADLRITDVEFDALYKVLGMLERDEVKYAPLGEPICGRDITPVFFNMALVKSNGECGTAACIMGWARYFGGDDLFRRLLTPALNDLFCMGHEPGSPFRGKLPEDILPSDAAPALRSYLTHGEPCWTEAFAAA